LDVTGEMVTMGKLGDRGEMVKARPFLQTILHSICKCQVKTVQMAKMVEKVKTPIVVGSHEMLTVTCVPLRVERAAMVVMGVMGVMAVH
jgi:hypothetical protein